MVKCDAKTTKGVRCKKDAISGKKKCSTHMTLSPQKDHSKATKSTFNIAIIYLNSHLKEENLNNVNTYYTNAKTKKDAIENFMKDENAYGVLSSVAMLIFYPKYEHLFAKKYPNAYAFLSEAKDMIDDPEASANINFAIGILQEYKEQITNYLMNIVPDSIFRVERITRS